VLRAAAGVRWPRGPGRARVGKPLAVLGC